MKRIYLIALFYFFLLDSSFSQKGSGQPEILFVGNSLTYTNNLPKLVEKEASRHGINLVTKMVAEPNYAIVDHLDYGNLKEVIQNGHYDYVIIQQGPSSQKEGRRLLIEAGQRLKVICENKKIALCYFMVWPSRQYYYTFDDVIANHEEAAQINGAVLLPVGTNWKSYIQSTQNWDFYGGDGFHPSKKGSEFAARIIVETLFLGSQTE